MAQGYQLNLPPRVFDSNGQPGDAFEIYTYVANGAFSTPLTTYNDATLLTMNTNPIIADASGYYRAFVADAVAVDVAVKNAASVQQYTQRNILPMPSPGFDETDSYNRTGATDSNGTYASATLTNPTVTGNSVSGIVVAKSVTFAETATGVLHTATIPIPAGAELLDILVSGGALWGAVAAVLNAGDTADPDGYIAAMSLKATDLLPGEVFSVSGSTNNWGGKNGAYLVAATGQRGPTTTNFGSRYVAGSNIIATVTVTTPSVTTGRTYLTVFYAVGQTVAPVVT